MADKNMDARQLAVLLEELLGPTTAEGQPILRALQETLRDMDAMKLTLKFFGFELAEELAKHLPVRSDLRAHTVNLGSKACTQEDLESEWAAYWASELKVPIHFSRKLWEYVFVLQAIHEAGLMEAGRRGLGFGCGQEPIPSYLAARNIDVTVTDLPPGDAAARAWQSTNQHLALRESGFRKKLVSAESFEQHVSLQYCDMNRISEDLRGYDFCWSICALEHLGSIRHGLEFIKNSLDTLAPSGLAVHTTEFNFWNDEATIDNAGTVLFQKRHFQQLAEELRTIGHAVAPLNFDVGSKPLDRFIDLPPYTAQWRQNQRKMWGQSTPHLKFSIRGFPATGFGLIVRKKK